ncbi:hypothetical protein EXIGLDRAFT_776001 [Exidia glandulosa HHB12029]|uniref:Uncharacterized protein n=1 Tax=Exidia glandulosa HHB12029 TaxID=1314781 RepID=A0A165DN21_EXIGL|nr:hypothetical protein EXIGLDRAFT_776001 [Exidia glandulosa HHB12029]
MAHLTQGYAEHTRLFAGHDQFLRPFLVIRINKMLLNSSASAIGKAQPPTRRRVIAFLLQDILG